MNRKRNKKTDYRDTEAIAKALRNNDYSAVATHDKQDEAIRDYIHEREAQKKTLKAIKQRIGALCNRQGFHYEAEDIGQRSILTGLRVLLSLTSFSEKF